MLYVLYNINKISGDFMEAEYLNLSEDDRKSLEYAAKLLENPGILIRAMNTIGSPIETAIQKLPAAISKQVNKAADMALNKAADLALSTLSRGGVSKEDSAISEKMHKLAAGFSGAVGGLFGLPGILADLPATTVLMLRSIMKTAQEYGEDLSDPQTIAACMEVFALGGNSKADDGSETGYYSVRYALSASIRQAENYLASQGSKGIADKSAPALIRLIANISQRFGITVSEKAMAQAIPVIGAAGGAAINIVFMNHFQDMARGHFIVRRLERKYGKAYIEEKYKEIKKNMR